MRRLFVILNVVLALFIAETSFSQNFVPFIDTVIVEQIPENLNVEINYDVFDLDNDTLIVLVKMSNDDGVSFNVSAKTFTGNYGLGNTSGARTIIWDAVADYPEQYSNNFRAKLFVSDAKINKMVAVTQGSFAMGEGVGDDGPVHDVTLDRFEICPHAVTNEEYKLFCDITNRAAPPEGGANQAPNLYVANYGSYPVVGVSWYDAVAYCNWLSELAGLELCYDTATWEYDSTKSGYHLPTEAQWEKASRGGLQAKIYPWGDEDPANRCNYNGYAGLLMELMPDFLNDRGPLPVDSLNTNGYGILNAVGNVWEWCNDWYNLDYYANSPQVNPMGPESGFEKVARGGAWDSEPTRLHCAFRQRFGPTVKRFTIGFRIAR